MSWFVGSTQPVLHGHDGNIRLSGKHIDIYTLLFHSVFETLGKSIKKEKEEEESNHPISIEGTASRSRNIRGLYQTNSKK